MRKEVKSKSMRLSSQVRHRAVGDEGVLVHLENGRVVVVNQVGLHIVNRLKEPAAHEDLVESIAAEFDVSSEQAAEDLDVFLIELDQDQLLDRR